MNNGITERTKFRCLFEQSGTFKGELKSLGFAAFDYDIRNDYGETDFEVDLFKEIESAFEAVAYHKKRREVELDQRTRSEISKEYANRFIREFIL